MNLLITIITGLLAGSVGNWIVTGPVERRRENVQIRHTSQARLYGIVRDYRARLRHEHTYTPGNHTEGLGTVSARGIVEFTAAVLAELPYLSQTRWLSQWVWFSKRRAFNLRRMVQDRLDALAGPELRAAAERKLYLPASVFDPQMESLQYEMLDRRISMEPDYAENQGLLALVHKTPNEGDRHRQVVAQTFAVLDEIADLVRPY